MAFFDRDNQSATLDRPKNEAPKGEAAPVSPAPAQRANAASTASAAPVGTPHTSSPRAKSSPTLKIRWTSHDGDVMSEYMQTLAPTGKAMGSFHISKPEGWPAGRYKLEMLLNETIAATMDYDVS